MLSHFPELEGVLSGETTLGGKVTVFMPSDLTIMSLRNETRKNLFVDHSDRALKVITCTFYTFPNMKMIQIDRENPIFIQFCQNLIVKNIKI